MVDEQPAATITDHIRADRACAGCGFNLFGQTVTKEAHYGLAIARCPECGTVAALQQYPVMTHWVNRFRAILAGLYLLLLLAVFGLSTLAISAFALNGADLASEPLADRLGLDFTNWTGEQARAAQQQPQAGITQTTTANGGTVTSFSINGQATTITTAPTTGSILSPGSYQWTTLTPEWIDNHLDASVDSFGSLWVNMNREVFVFMIPAAFFSLCVGIFWTVALLGATRRRALLVPCAMVLVGTAFAIGLNMDSQYYTWASNVARHIYIPMMVPFIMGVELVFLVIGVWIGRPFARVVVRMALPPRLRIPLSILWTRDGLTPPRV